MGSPLEDYAAKCWDEAQEEKYREKEYHNCSACGDNFCPEIQHGGMKLTGENEYYCPDCVKFSNHIAYIRNYASNTEEALFIINDLKYL